MKMKEKRIQVDFRYFLIILLEFLTVVLCEFHHKATPACRKSAQVCKFEFDIRYKFSMVYYFNGYSTPIVVRNGTLLRRSVYDTEKFTPLTPEELKEIITVDGVYKLLFTINGDFPGPPIVVYEGQTIEVLVKNHLSNEVLTIHWHGMHQKNTPWMDGASMISQCPVRPGQSFLYRFKADPKGTHWYHSHQGTLRGEGLAGPLIVLPREERKDTPAVEDDFIIVIQEWNRNKSSIEISEIHAWNMHIYSDDYNCTSNCYEMTHTIDGTTMGIDPFHSALINGKGHHYPNGGGNPLIPELPLETFKVKPNRHYRFRIINVAMFFSFRFSIDEHSLLVISTDGNDVEPETAQSVIVASGERYDVLVQTKENSTENYYIRAENMETKTQYQVPIYPGLVKAVLQYEDATEKEPTTQSHKCTDVNKCKVINCPNKYYPEEANIECLPVSDLRSTREVIDKYPVPTPNPDNTIRENFLNFHFTSADYNQSNPVYKASINGHVFAFPSCPPQSTYGPRAHTCIEECNSSTCDPQCRCSNMLNYEDMPLGSPVQLVFLNMDRLRGATDHPVHMHGHSFHVLKIGFSDVNISTGIVTNFTEDIQCSDVDCKYPRWKNNEWANGNIPGLNLKNPPLKDTVVVPRGGYVVLRMYLENPGFWYLHCHMDAHLVEGMALIIKEGHHSTHPKPPKDFPTCGDFTWSLEEFNAIGNNEEAVLGSTRNSTSDDLKKSSERYSHELMIALVITAFAGSSAFLLCVAKFFMSKHITNTSHQTPYIHNIHDKDNFNSYGSI